MTLAVPSEQPSKIWLILRCHRTRITPRPATPICRGGGLRRAVGGERRWEAAVGRHALLAQASRTAHLVGLFPGLGPEDDESAVKLALRKGRGAGRRAAQRQTRGGHLGTACRHTTYALFAARRPCQYKALVRAEDAVSSTARKRGGGTGVSRRSRAGQRAAQRRSISSDATDLLKKQGKSDAVCCGALGL